MSKFSDLTAGVYSGYENQGNYGWLLKSFNGGSAFFIRNYSKGIIKHNQIEEYVTRIEKELDPEKDSDEFRQLHDLILEIGKSHPQLVPIIDEVKKIVQAYSFAKYNDSHRIKFPN
jgi:hypothetical protein